MNIIKLLQVSPILALLFFARSETAIASQEADSKNLSDSQLLKGVVSANELIDILEQLGVKCIEDTAGKLYVNKVRLGSAAFYKGIQAGDAIKSWGNPNGQDLTLSIVRTGQIYKVSFDSLQTRANKAPLPGGFAPSSAITSLSQLATITGQKFKGIDDETTIKEKANYALDNLNGLTGFDQFIPDKISPVRQSLQIGNLFKPADYKNCACSSPWYRIPPWMTGVWTFMDNRATATNVYSFDRCCMFVEEFIMEAQMHGRRVGILSDKKGQVWHHWCLPFRSDLEVNQVHIYNLVTAVNPLVISDNRVVIRGHTLRIATEPNSMFIADVKQQETVSTFTPVDARHIEVNSEEKSFDQNGKPIVAFHTNYQLVLLAPYRPSRKQEKVDCYSMFCKYLIDNRLNELIPDPVPPMDVGMTSQNKIPQLIQLRNL